ncbi:MAG: hypothetical protein AAF074_19365 [Pseudomonadota bacterium]
MTFHFQSFDDSAAGGDAFGILPILGDASGNFPLGGSTYDAGTASGVLPVTGSGWADGILPINGSEWDSFDFF